MYHVGDRVAWGAYGTERATITGEPWEDDEGVWFEATGDDGVTYLLRDDEVTKVEA